MTRVFLSHSKVLFIICNAIIACKIYISVLNTSPTNTPSASTFASFCHPSIMSIPKVGKACVIHDKGPNHRIELRTDYPVPSYGEDELLIKLTCTGICATEYVLGLAIKNIK